MYAITTSFGGIVTAQEPVPVQSSVFNIEYRINDDALPLGAVQLWYTLDRGETWVEYGFDSDRQSPITFQAQQEGLFGFYLVVSNTTGPSSTAPTSHTEPHLWAFVDQTPPVVQLHPLRQTAVLGERVLQVRWTAVDAHLPARPVMISYQRPPDDTWYAVTEDPLPNTGRYDWRLVDELSGAVALRVSVNDKGGHGAHSERVAFEITPPVARTTPRIATDGGSGFAGADSVTSGSPRVGNRANELFAAAAAHRARGEYREGIALLREAVKLDPKFAQAFAEMAGMLYRIGDLDRALKAYELALQQRPTMRAALRGAAMIYRNKNDHATAARYLRTILRHSPNDAEVWMNLGDIAVFQGDEILARECYTRATENDPNATQVIEDARKRLALMAQVSRTFRPDGK